MRPQASLWLKDQCLLGAYVRGVIVLAHRTGMDGPIGCALGRKHCDNSSLGWCGANSLMVSGFYFSLGLFTILCVSESGRSFMGGTDVVHCVRGPLTGTTVATSRAH